MNIKTILAAVAVGATVALTGCTDADVASKNLSKAADVSTYHYRVTFKPQTILPDIDFRGDAGELTKDRN